MSEDGLKVLATVLDSGAAHVIRSLMQSHDIECHVFDDNASAVGFGIRDIRVLVDANDLDKAQKILKGMEA